MLAKAEATSLIDVIIYTNRSNWSQGTTSGDLVLIFHSLASSDF
jgi:hypothetical protein